MTAGHEVGSLLSTAAKHTTSQHEAPPTPDHTYHLLAVSLVKCLRSEIPQASQHRLLHVRRFLLPPVVDPCSGLGLRLLRRRADQWLPQGGSISMVCHAPAILGKNASGVIRACESPERSDVSVRLKDVAVRRSTFGSGCGLMGLAMGVLIALYCATISTKVSSEPDRLGAHDRRSGCRHGSFSRNPMSCPEPQFDGNSTLGRSPFSQRAISYNSRMSADVPDPEMRNLP